MDCRWYRKHGRRSGVNCKRNKRWWGFCTRQCYCGSLQWLFSGEWAYPLLRTCRLLKGIIILQCPFKKGDWIFIIENEDGDDLKLVFTAVELQMAMFSGGSGYIEFEWFGFSRVFELFWVNSSIRKLSSPIQLTNCTSKSKIIPQSNHQSDQIQPSFMYIPIWRKIYTNMKKKMS